MMSFTFLHIVIIHYFVFNSFIFIIDGQAIATKVSKQITQRTNSLKVAVEKYNASLAAWKDRVNGLPEELDFDTVKDPESEVFQDFRGNISNKDQVPYSVRRNVIDLHNFIERCKEEISYLDDHHVTERARFEKWITEHSDDTLVYVRGINCILEKRKREAENKLYAIGSIFGDRLPLERRSSIPDDECKFVSIDTTTETFETKLVELKEGEDVDDEQPDDDIVLILESSDDEDGDEVEDEDETEFNMDL